MEVNFFSYVALTQKCLPLIKLGKGRIVNMTSMAGLFLGTPLMSGYCASKHACEAWTTALRFELKCFNIPVVTINPSFHRTPIVTSAEASLRRSYDALSESKKAEYGVEYLNGITKKTIKMMGGSYDPRHVVNALVNATTAVKPKSQYIVGSDAKFQLLPMLCLNTPLLEHVLGKTEFKLPQPASVALNRAKLE